MTSCSFEQLRRATREASAPCIPHLGTVIHEVSVIRDTNGDVHVPGAEQLVNWVRAEALARALYHAERFRATPFSDIEADQRLSSWLRSSLAGVTLTLKSAYELSLLVEPLS
eukprot:m51a1_g9405 hypothetical protein (112) ;mRNA; f:304328-304663